MSFYHVWFQRKSMFSLFFELRFFRMNTLTNSFNKKLCIAQTADNKQSERETESDCMCDDGKCLNKN